MLDIIQSIAIVALGVVVVTKLSPKGAIRRRADTKPVLLDTCALIDGRIVELVKAGFMPSNLVVPEFIVAELQLLADGSDSHKRERARFGLEVVRELQAEPGIEIRIDHTKVDAKTTDDKLVKLAQKVGASLYTTDFNLNQVANIEGVQVLNVNELSHALRPVALPGEAFEVKVLQVGSNRDQGVGYMDDGTMIVIDSARKDVGKKVKVKITRTHQTVAGKMLFAQKVEEPKIKSQQPKAVPQKRSVVAQQSPAQRPPRAIKQRSGAQHRKDITQAESSLFDAIDKLNNQKP